MNKIIYLDNNATTQIDPEVLVAMREDNFPANPSSIHYYGRKAKSLLINAKDNIAKFLNVSPNELIFTSGGTESVNLAIKGLIKNKNNHIISSDIDHACIHNSLVKIQDHGCNVSFVSCSSGAINVKQIEEQIKPNTSLIVVSAVNSETGVKVDLKKISALAKLYNIPLVVDAVALLGKEKFTIFDGITAMCFSSHKIHGPKGIGLLFLRKDTRLTSQMLGGAQEKQQRAGTENLSGILGFSKAIELAYMDIDKTFDKMKNLRDHFERSLIDQLDNVSINGSNNRICNTSNLSFKGVSAEDLLIKLDQHNILASHGSACSSGSLSPSRVLLNMGIEPKLVRSSLRFSICRNTTKEEIDTAIDLIVKIVYELRYI